MRTGREKEKKEAPLHTGEMAGVVTWRRIRAWRVQKTVSSFRLWTRKKKWFTTILDLAQDKPLGSNGSLPALRILRKIVNT